MKTEGLNGKAKEQRLVKLYMDLTGTSEAEARGVFMYVCGGSGAKPEKSDATASGEADAGSEPRGDQPGLRGLAGLVLVLAGLWVAGEARAAEAGGGTNAFITSPISMADAVDLALRQNPNVLRAQRDVEAAQGVVIQTRAIAVPKLVVGGSYQWVQKSDIDSFQTPGFSFGNNQSWLTQVKVVQSIYEGGKMASALRTARLTREQSMLQYQSAVADAIVDVQVAYYDVLLAAQQITVRERSVELLTSQLQDTTRRYDAGTVPRFNVLRAEVELANEKPNLIRARNAYRIAKNVLANLLGFNLPKETVEEIPLTLSDKLSAEPYDMDLSKGIAMALERRPELKALGKAQALRREDLSNARAGYKPSVQAFAGYDVHNSQLSQDLMDENHGLLAGAQLNWNVFDGFRTRGQIKQAAANYERAGVDLDDGRRRIELEVRTANSNFIQAREVLESTKKAVEQAEEALRLATARYEAGTGTQLDVLSARTALTEAQTTQNVALREYSVARVRLERAVAANLPAPPEVK